MTAGDRAVFALGNAGKVLSSDCPLCKITAIVVRDIEMVMRWSKLTVDTPLSLTWSHKGPGSKGVFRVNDRDTFTSASPNKAPLAHQLQICHLPPLVSSVPHRPNWTRLESENGSRTVRGSMGRSATRTPASPAPFGMSIAALSSCGSSTSRKTASWSAGTP